MPLPSAKDSFVLQHLNDISGIISLCFFCVIKIKVMSISTLFSSSSTQTVASVSGIDEQNQQARRLTNPRNLTVGNQFVTPILNDDRFHLQKVKHKQSEINHKVEKYKRKYRFFVQRPNVLVSLDVWGQFYTTQ